MIKVYLDNNIYRLLEKDENKVFNELLRSKINRDFLVLYSQAHINDLSQDVTEKKYENLDFMDGIVEDNFLLHQTNGDVIVNQLVRPREAYEYFSPEIDSLEQYFNEFFTEIQVNDDLKEISKPLLNLFEKTPISLGLSDYFQDDPKLILDRLGLSEEPKSLLDWMPQFGRMIDSLKADKSIIKDVRNLNKEFLQVEKLNIDINSIDFDNRIAETPLGISFTKLIDDTIGHMTEQEKKRYRYMKFVLSFSMLNFLGLDKEKNKKVRYMNTHHDGEHFFYSTLSDWVVSNDAGFRNKAKFLVNLFGLDLKIMNYSEFKFHVKQVLSKSDISAQQLIDTIGYEIKSGIITNSSLSISRLQKMTTIVFNTNILNFFNRASFVNLTDGTDESYFVLYQDGKKVYHYKWYKDFRSMTNKLVSILGIDVYGKGNFTDQDYNSIENVEWYGREWKVGNVSLRLTINVESYRMNLIYGPFYI